jgi:adenylate cyclase
MEGIDWALCTPVRGQSSDGWFLYVAGRSVDTQHALHSGPKPPDLRGDVKFTELVASVLGSLRDVRSLQHRESVYNQFFSQRVAAAIAKRDPDEVLRERVTDVVVLFCDLRGFTKEVERAEREGDLPTAYNRVREALGIATRQMLAHEGVIGDFHGDAVMGFWGWPETQPQMVERACRAALGIRREFRAIQQQHGHTLVNFDMGIGLAMGRAMAGRIGTQDQVKVTVFGSIVNLASRLEGMTKILQAPVLVDKRVGDYVRQHPNPDVVRCRRLGRFLPQGSDEPVEVTEILPPLAEFSELTDQDLAHFEEAVAQFEQGQWEESLLRFHRVTPADRAKDLLVTLICNGNRRPPANWNGIVKLERKS